MARTERDASRRASYIFSETSVASVALQAEIDECQQRLLSGEILMSTAASNHKGASWNDSSREVVVQPFVEVFDRELRRLGGILSNLQLTTELSAEALLKDADGLSRRKEHGKLSGSSLAQEVDSLQQQAKNLQKQTLKRLKETMKNQNELQRLALKADSKLKTSCMDECEREFSKNPWSDSASAGHIVKLLSDIFSLIRKIEEDEEEKDGKWVAPQSFERVTTKYWVKEEDLPEVLLKSASDFPLLVYGKSGLLTKNPKNPSKGKGEFWKSMASPISSVYFDSENLDLYRERIKRSEGAQLVRVRWYGNNKPNENALVFLELKTHHECWISNKSVKERVTIAQYRMKDMIDVSGGSWTKEFAQKIVVEATGSNFSEEELAASRDLLLEIRNVFCKWNLKPCVRTSYTRAAFQNPDNNNIRLTIDRDITVVDEMQAYKDRCRTGKEGWCIENQDLVSIDSFAKVPYGVFEVKVSLGESPLLVEELIASDAIVEVPKFSKFLTGASLHNFNKVDIILPWWSEDALFAPMFKLWKSTSRIDVVDASSKPLLGVEEGRVKQTNDEGANTLGKTDTSERQEGIEKPISYANGLRNRHPFWQKKKQGTQKKSVAPRSPARVEPKSFFANERTFIQWITVGSLFMFVAGFVYEVGLTEGSRHGSAFMWFGNGLIGCALFVVVYGTGVYYRRLHLMMNAKPYGYSDTFGPAVLASFMVTLLSTYIYVFHVQFPYPNQSLVETPGVCVLRNLNLGPSSGIAFLQFEPSAVVVEEERNIIIVASLDEIIALPAGLPIDDTSVNAPIQIIHRFSEGTEDLEGLEIVNGTIYALSENKKDLTSGYPQSDLIALDWKSDGTLIESDRWRIDAPFAEGMAHTDDPNWFGSSYMLVSADMKFLYPKNPDDRLELIRLPFAGMNNTKGKLPRRRVNNKFFVKNLKDTKVASMQYFGGLLYVLYDNDMLIRAYDYVGNTINQWNLPIGVTYYGKQWEGMRLEQKGNDLYLHLTLDSPPQVWTIKLEGETSAELAGSGQWSFPKCAGGA